MKVSGSLTLLQMAESGTLTGEIELDGAEYTLDRPLVITKPVCIDGCGAHFSGTTPSGIMVYSGDVVLKNFTMDGFAISISVDAKGRTISNIRISHVDVNDPGYGMVFNVGSTESDSRIEDIHFEDCTIRMRLRRKNIHGKRHV